MKKFLLTVLCIFIVTGFLSAQENWIDITLVENLTRGGIEDYQPGDTMHIEWYAYGSTIQDEVVIRLVEVVPPSDPYYPYRIVKEIVTQYPNVVGVVNTYDWVIPNDVPSYTPEHNYKVRIRTLNKTVYAHSNTIYIAPYVPDPPWIDVAFVENLSGGVDFTAGDTMHIEWHAGGTNIQDQVLLRLVEIVPPSDPYYPYRVVVELVNPYPNLTNTTNVFEWVIPYNLPIYGVDHDYRILVRTLNKAAFEYSPNFYID